MNRFLGFVLAITSGFVVPAAASGQPRGTDEPAPPPSRKEVLDEIFRNKWCALAERQASNIRELRELVTEDGVSDTPAEALRMSRNQTYLYLEVQKSIRSVLTDQEEFNAWAREQAQDPEIVDYNADDEKAWDALSIVIRKLIGLHPLGKRLEKAASALEKVNEKLIESSLADQYQAMVDGGEIQGKELREFHDKITEQLRAERRKRDRISELVREREELERAFYPELYKLFELRSRLEKYDLRRDPDFEGDFGGTCGDEWRKLRDCPACWKQDWEEKRYRHVEAGDAKPASSAGANRVRLGYTEPGTIREERPSPTPRSGRSLSEALENRVTRRIEQAGEAETSTAVAASASWTVDITPRVEALSDGTRLVTFVVGPGEPIITGDMPAASRIQIGADVRQIRERLGALRLSLSEEQQRRLAATGQIELPLGRAFEGTRKLTVEGSTNVVVRDEGRRPAGEEER